MALKTPEQYFDSLRRLKRRVFILGEEVAEPNDHPIIRPTTNAVAKTYELAQKPELAGLMTVKSPLTNETINRFCHIQGSMEDMIKKVKMLRLVGQQTATCFQRCAGLDCLNSLYSITWEADKELGTEYHARFLRFMKRVQAEDLVCDAAMTDARGDRSKAPHEQADPDLFLHIVEQKPDGIVVRGAKAHQTGALNSHEVVVMPTTAMKAGSEDYAVAFAVPADAEGITYICGRQSCDTRKTEASKGDVGNPNYGGHEALIVFDNVFVPWERIFMFRETAFTGRLVERFASYHRTSYGGCKVGMGDVLIWATAAIAEYIGVDKAAHVRDKLAEMTHMNETLHAGAIAASADGYRLESGNYMVDLLLANTCKLNVTRLPWEISRIAQDIAGGLLVTLPGECDFANPQTGPYLKKYLMGVSRVPVEDKVKILRLIENITMGTGAVGYLTESIHGAGSPQAQKIMIQRYGNWERKKDLAKRIAGIGQAPDGPGKRERE
jgi:4-hydroxybutyryl-CoA dehydratase/vinylacetyl-CoA-Delta-isomerase